MNRQIALVEDDDVVRAEYAERLRNADFTVDAYSFKEGPLASILQRPPDLALLILAFHHERHPSFTLCAELRRRSDTLPIVFLASQAAEAHRIFGFRLGADDYITKEVSLEYLTVRLESLFRRCEAHEPLLINKPRTIFRPTLAESEVSFDEPSSQAYWRGIRLDLPLAQYRMLRDLCTHRGEIRTHTDLMYAAQIVVLTTTVVGHINALRDKFRQIDPSFDHIRTERGRGYRWVSLYF